MCCAEWVSRQAWCALCSASHQPLLWFRTLPLHSCRVELAQMLCSGLPLPYDYSGLLCETLFAQLLRLPGPRLCPVAFSALIAHAALLRPAFPKYLAGSVRQLYLRLGFLAPELAERLADVLAHFITNMNFRCGTLLLQLLLLLR